MRAQVSVRGAAASREAADALARNVLPFVREIETIGVATLRAMKDALTTRGIRTVRGGEWYASTVRYLLARAEAAPAASC